MVVLHLSIADIKIQRLTMLLSQPLLVQELLTLSCTNLRVVNSRHRQPGMVKHLLGRGTIVRRPVQHGVQEIGESRCLSVVKLVLLLQDLLERPEVQAMDVPQMARRFEILAATLASMCHSFGHAAQQLHHLRQVIVVLSVLLTFTRLKEEVTSSNLEDHARKGPHVCSGVVLGTDDHFR